MFETVHFYFFLFNAGLANGVQVDLEGSMVQLQGVDRLIVGKDWGALAY